jgi:hypothetical protein
MRLPYWAGTVAQVESPGVESLTNLIFPLVLTMTDCNTKTR